MMEQYAIKLYEQSTLCPILPISFDRIDRCLKEYVDFERKYLSKRNQNQMIKFKVDMEQKNLYETIIVHSPVAVILDQLITIRQRQVEVWEEQLMLEMRIICQFLPPNFDHLENFISPIMPITMNNEQRNIRLKNERLQIIQEAKRQWLHLFLTSYEVKLQEYDCQYQQILEELTSVASTVTYTANGNIVNDINRYMTYRTSQLKQDILNRMTLYRRKLRRNRQRSSVAKNRIGVSPEPYLDLMSNPFTTREWNYLKLGKICCIQ